LSAFIAGAKKDLAIYDSKVQDPSMIKLLKERAAKGVQVRVLGDMKGKDPSIEERKLSMRLHVRAIVRDGRYAFVGSQSLRKDELENRREVGLIINNPAVARKLLQVFESDWADSSKGAKDKAAKEKLEEKAEKRAEKAAEKPKTAKKRAA
jgi:cardiolipin synthase